MLLDCYLSGQVPDSAWNEHLKDPEFARFVTSEMGPGREPEPTLGARERAFNNYMGDNLGGDLLARSRDHSGIRAIAHDLFKAGWNARKQLDYEAALGIKR
jgi:hypothetical protein